MYISRFDVHGQNGKKYSFRRKPSQGIGGEEPYEVFLREGFFSEFVPTGETLVPELVEFMKRLSAAQQTRLRSGNRATFLLYEDLVEYYAKVQQAAEILLRCFPAVELFRQVLKQRGHGLVAGTSDRLPS